jgi:hypothetical protein
VLVCSQSWSLALQWAREQQCPWDVSTCINAAWNGQLHTLKWARGNDCPWDLGRVLYNAERLYGDALVWLEQQSDRPWTAAEKTRLLDFAGRRDRLATMQWLRKREAAWPNSFVGTIGNEARNIAWGVPAMEYALANGYTWADAHWQCQQLAPELYTDVRYRRNAIKVLAWAHNNGCPCTCNK